MAHAPTPPAPPTAPLGAEAGNGMPNWLKNSVSGEFEFMLRRLLRENILGSDTVRSAISVVKKGNKTVIQVGPAKWGLEFPVELGVHGLVIASSNLPIKNATLKRYLTELVEEVAYTFQDEIRRGRIPTQDEVDAAKKKTEDRWAFKLRVILDGTKMIAHAADCIVIAVTRPTAPPDADGKKKGVPAIERTYKQVKEQGVPLALTCATCGKKLKKLEAEAKTMSDDHGASGDGGHGKGKLENLSMSHALGLYLHEHPEDADVLTEFMDLLEEEDPRLAQKAREINKKEEWESLAKLKTHRARMMVLKTGGKPVTWLDRVSGHGGHHSPEDIERAAVSKRRKEQAIAIAQEEGGILGFIFFGRKEKPKRESLWVRFKDLFRKSNNGGN